MAWGRARQYIIDLGPEGGEVIATGTPEQIAANEGSFTGQFLRHVLPEWSAESGERKVLKGRKKEPAGV